MMAESDGCKPDALSLVPILTQNGPMLDQRSPAEMVCWQRAVTCMEQVPGNSA